MNVAKWLLLTLLMLPFLELAAFVAVAAAIGLGWALALVLASSLAGALILRHAGGSHIARVRVALNSGSLTALQADQHGGLILFAGFLLLIPGFITDAIGVCMLLMGLLRTTHGAPPAASHGVVDLAPEQWHQVPDQALPPRRQEEREQ